MRQATFILFFIICLHLEAQQIIPLYQSAIPNSRPYKMKEELIERDGMLIGY